MTTETKADEFKVGDTVYCALCGKGEVTCVKYVDKNAHYKNAHYPIVVNFDRIGPVWYTLDGKYSEEYPRTLFFSEPKIEASVTRPFVPTLEGKYVVVETGDGTVNGRVFDETPTHFKLDSGYSFAKAMCQAIYEVYSENLLK